MILRMLVRPSLLKIRTSARLQIYYYLEKLVLKGHVRFWLKTNTCTKDVGQGPALLRQSIDYRRTWRG